MANSYTILGLGFAKWWGSDGRALAQAFRNLGHAIIDLDEEDYVSWRPQGARSKIIRRLVSSAWVDDYNQAVLSQVAQSAYDFVLVFKGNLLKPETIGKLCEAGKPVYNFYPDVSFVDHGPRIPESLRFYDCVFSTKSYHGEKEIARFGIRRLQHVRHGFDPEIHRPIEVSPDFLANYECDVSFVGCWSREKEERLSFLLKGAPELHVRTYGLGWHYSSSEFQTKLGSNLRPGVFGDELSIVHGASKVNLGLLSSAASDASLRDQVTARSFQIPAARGFMLHEDTPEIRSFFEDGREIMLFSNNEEMVEKTRFALSAPQIRLAMQTAAYERCQRDGYNYSSAARDIVTYFEVAKGVANSSNATSVLENVSSIDSLETAVTR